MNRWVRSSVKCLFGIGLMIGVVGCTTEEEEAALGPGQPVSGQVAARAEAANLRSGTAQAKESEAQVTTPARSIDIKALSETVKEEVKGGEATLGATPFDHLWMPAKPGLIKDEPLVVTVPKPAFGR